MRIVCLKIHLKDLCQKQIFLKNQMGAFTAVRLRSVGHTSHKTTQLRKREMSVKD